MVFKCQEDSFLKEFTSTVVSCEKANFAVKDADQPVDGFNVVLSDTILFPEGGGQPCDRGRINGKPVINVTRVGAEAVHFVQSDQPFVVGDVAEQRIDWDRRFDHMQQHSGQHLITAVFEQDYQFGTTTWNLGAETSFVELDTKSVGVEQLREAEAKINSIIAHGRTVSVINADKEAILAPEVTRATRGLPKDHVGAIRVITFHGIESNMCCGTHVTNLSQLQAVKFLNTEKSKGRTLLHFVVGNRVLQRFTESFERENELNLLLNCGPTTHVSMVKKIKDTVKSTQRAVLKLLKELAAAEAKKTNELSACKYYFTHRTDGQESEFIGPFLKQIVDKELFAFVTTADESMKGKFVLQGKASDVTALGPILCELLDGKGNGSNGRYQAKVNNLRKISDCEAAIRRHFDE